MNRCQTEDGVPGLRALNASPERFAKTVKNLEINEEKHGRRNHYEKERL